MLCSFDMVVYIIFLITHSPRRSPLATAANMYQGSNSEIRDQSSQEKGKKVVEVVAKLNFPFFPFGRGIPIQIMYTSWSEVLFLRKSLKCICSYFFEGEIAHAYIRASIMLISGEVFLLKMWLWAECSNQFIAIGNGFYLTSLLVTNATQKSLESLEGEPPIVRHPCCKIVCKLCPVEFTGKNILLSIAP